MRRVAVLTVIAGCRLRFGDVPDARIDDASMVDTLDAYVFPTGPFMNITAISELNTLMLDDDPTATSDVLELYFQSQRAGGMGMCDIWTTTRASRTDAWAPPTNVTMLNSTFCESGPNLSPDGLTLYFASTRTGATDPYMTTRASRGAPWSAPVLIMELVSTTVDSAPSVTEDQLATIFMSTRDSGDQLYEARRATPTDPWGTPTLLTELNSTSRDRSPHLSPDGLTVYFASDRPGGLGDNDLFMSTRPSRNEPFAPPTRMLDLSTALREDDPWISPDGRVALWTSQGAGGDSDLFVATREP